MQLLDMARMAVGLTTNHFDPLLEELIEAGFADLGQVAILVDNRDDPLLKRAVTTYVTANFPGVKPEDYDRLKASYDEQKAQMMSATGYTDWGPDDEA